MEPSSAVRKRKMCWRNLWQLVFLAASILSSCFLLTEGQGSLSNIQIQVQPEHPAEGQGVTLTPKGNIQAAITCSWYRGEKTFIEERIVTYFPKTDSQNAGAAFTNLETVGPDCSLHIRNLSSIHTGKYTLNAVAPGLNALGTAFLIVSEYLPSPLLESYPPNGMVAENSDAILNCRTSNQSDVSVFWSKDGKPLPTTMGVLSNWNHILTLAHVAKSNAGTYRCMAKNLISQPASNPVQILVTYGPEIKLNPEGTLYTRLNSDMVMECLVDSVPEATLQWFFNGIKQSTAESILKVKIKNREDTGAYTCRAMNPSNNHTDERTCYVMLKKSLSPGTIAGIVVGCVAGVALAGGLLYFISKTSIRARMLHRVSIAGVQEPSQADKP